jgi:hypothetical protein
MGMAIACSLLAITGGLEDWIYDLRHHSYATQVHSVAGLLFIAYPRCCPESGLVDGCIGNDLE